MYNLKGKVAMVTGTARKKGMGRAFVQRLAEEGADIVVQSRYRPPEEYPEWEKMEGWKGLDSLVEEVEALGHQAVAVTGDICVREEVEQMVAKALARFGHIDILVNNAGLHSSEDRDRILDMPEEKWNSYMTTNVNGTLWMSQAVAKSMKEHGQGGKIILMSSSAALHPASEAHGAYYGISKLAMLGLCHCMAAEFAPYNINVNTVLPAAITLPVDGRGIKYMEGIHKGLGEEEAMAYAYPEGLNRPPASAMANLVAFLASSQSDCLTDQIIEGGRFAALRR
ncbi:SDR family NAD(P)-dependent oxidoreductase [Chloroflexota bacterium]